MEQKKNALLRITLSFLFIGALSFEGLFAQTPSLVKDIASGTTSSTPGLFLTFNNKLYFTASQGTGVNGGTRWFSTDGTNAGTYGISTPTSTGNFSPGSNTATSITTYNGSLYFSGATNGVADIELYKMTTGESISLIKDINSGTSGSSPGYLTVFNSKLYFSATDGSTNHGIELWSSDGTTSGTSMVYDINTTSTGASASPSSLTVLGNYLYFAASDGTTSGHYGKELWQLGTSGNPSLVADIYSGTGNSSSPANLTVFNSKLYFTATNATGTQVWCYDPTQSVSVGTNPFSLNTSMTAASGPVIVGSNLYFAGTVSGTSYIWKSDGTAANTAATSVTTPTSLVNASGTLFYVNSSDFQVYTYNGTSSTKLTTTTTLTSAPTLTAINSLVYFNGTDATYGAEPWVSDGTVSGTFRIGDINSGSSSANPASFYYFNGMVYFRATNGSTSSLTGSELYKYGYNTWTGAANNNFSTASNWSAGFVPDYTTDVSIPSASTMPSLSGTNTIRGLNILSGVSLTNSGILQVGGDLINNGSINGTLQLNGSIYQSTNGISNTAQSISGTGTITNLTLPTTNSNSTAYTNGATITSSMQNITGTLLVQAATLNTGGFLTLKSTGPTTSAVVGNVTGTISGNVIVERYIKSGCRGYRDIAPGVYNTTAWANGHAALSDGSIFCNWQEAGAVGSAATTGIFITGTTAKDATGAQYANYATVTATTANPAPNNGSGLDYSINGNQSAYTVSYTNGFTAPSFSPITNTQTLLDPFQGYRVLVRGARNFNLYKTPTILTSNGLLMQSATTLRASGNLIYGTVTYSTAGVTVTSGSSASSSYKQNGTINSFSMVANPYVCPVLWGIGDGNTQSATLTVLGASSGINGSYWLFDPTLGAVGFYRAYNGQTGSSSQYTNVGSGSTYPTGYQYIQPGEAFFIEAASASPNVVFTETAKSTASANLFEVFGATTPLSKIYLSLQKQVNGASTQVDGVAIAFNKGFGNTSYGTQDAHKINNQTDNLFIIDKNTKLSIDGRLPATANDVLPIGLSAVGTTNYQLQIDATTYTNNGFVPVLVDSYKGTTTSLSLGVNTIDFVADSLVSATYVNRFSIAFKPNALAVNSIALSASLVNKIATITWNTVGEKKVSGYEVEKSSDAKTFTTFAKATAKNTATASYSATDNSITTTTYYRVKAINSTGEISYSNVAKLATADSRFTVYPNPLNGKTLNVTLDNLASKYTISIYNTLGQKVHESTINHEGGVGSHAISIANTLAAGSYSLIIREAGSKQIVHQSNISVQP